MIYKHIQLVPRINLTSANEHIPEIERQIIVVKEITRSVSNILPFNNIPKIITIHIVFTVIIMINYLPVKGGVSAIPITKMIISSDALHYKIHLGIKIGQYCQVNENEDTSNSQVPRTKGTIFRGHIGNEQGGFQSLNS